MTTPAKQLDEGAVLDILERRAARLRAPQDVREDDLCWVAEFQIGGMRCAFRLESLRAVIPLRLVQPVPFSSRHVIGVARFRGQIITAMSLGSLVGIRGWSRDPFILLVVEHAHGHCAVDCESIPRVLALPATSVERAIAAAPAGATLVELTTSESGPPLTLLDLDRLLEGATSA